MTNAEYPVIVRVEHHFDAEAERVYDAFLDPAKASQFLFATATGVIVRCDIDARVGGRFTITDRRYGEDVVHEGTYVELDRPHRIVFTFAVEKYSDDVSRVTIEITPRAPGCVVTLLHEMPAAGAPYRQRTEAGWTTILEVAAQLVVDDASTCGAGLAQHAAILASMGLMFEGLADTLSLHRQLLQGEDPVTRQEDDVYRELAQKWTRIAAEVQEAAALMAAQRQLPMADHDERAWGEAHLLAFDRFVAAQSRLLGLLQVAAPRDERMRASMR